MNPLTGLRKLGIKLVGDNGLLDTYAAKAAGLGPLRQMDLMEQARKRGVAAVTDAQGIDKTDLEMAGEQQKQDQSSEKFPLEQEKLKTSNASDAVKLEDEQRNLAARKAAIPILAQKLGVTPEEAEGKLQSMEDLYKTGQIDINPEDAKFLGISPGIKGKEVVALRETYGRDKRAQATQDRLLAHQEEMDKRNSDKETKSDKKMAFNSAERIKGENDYKADIASINAAQDAQDAINGGIKPETTQLIITKLNKMTDPNSVVRESEYARTAEGRNALDRIRAWINRTGGTGGFPPDILKDINVSIQGLATSAKNRHKERVSRFKDMIKAYSDNVGDDYLDTLMPSFDKKDISPAALNIINGLKKQAVGN